LVHDLLQVLLLLLLLLLLLRLPQASQELAWRGGGREQVGQLDVHLQHTREQWEWCFSTIEHNL
jgi:hypothetical protein